MLQSQARLILYGEDDAWDSTQADNQDWLDVFKRVHGLIPNEASQAKAGSREVAPTGVQAFEQLNGQLYYAGGDAYLEEGMTQMSQSYVNDGMFELTLDDEDQEFHRLFQQAGMTNGSSYV